MSALVATDWLENHLYDADLRIIDGSWYLPRHQRDARAEYTAAHIPGARYFDIDAVADLEVDLPHTLPQPLGFEEAVGALGIAPHHHVVVYDGSGLFSAPRVWWTFRVFGHARVSVLDGGLPKWNAEGRPLTADVPTSLPTGYQANFRPELVRRLDEMRAVVEEQTTQVLDARSPGRFLGTAPEPRPQARSGHMPGSFNLPYASLVNEDGTLVKPAVLKAQLSNQNVALDRPIVTTCGSGVTAALLALGLYELGITEVAVYDGSWAEWGTRDDTPVVLD